MIKLNKRLLQGLSEAGIGELTGLQEKLVSRISGGASLYVVETEVYSPVPGAEGEPVDLANCPEKLTGLMIAILQKLNYSQPDTPRAIVIAATPEEAENLYGAFCRLTKETDLKVHLAHEKGDIEEQNIAIYTGADLVIATPKRLLKLYFQCGINVSRANLLMLYNASRIVDAHLMVEITRFRESLPKFQAIVHTEVLSEKVKKACGKFMSTATVID